MREPSELLLEEFGVSKGDLDKAINYQKKIGGRIEQLLVNIGSLPEDQLANYYSRLYGYPVYNELEDPKLDGVNLDVESLKKLVDCDWYPVGLENEHIVFAVKYPLDQEAQDILFSLGFDVFETKVATIEALNSLQTYYSNYNGGSDDSSASDDFDIEEDRLRELASEAPTVNLLNGLINKALRQNASDMHLEPVKGHYRVRFRIDGVLHDIEKLPGRLELPLATRLKILSGMDIAEKRRPQDGKIEMRISNHELDIRVSSLPLNEGESIVMRFLRKDAIRYDMSVLGISKDIEKNILEDLERTAGVILMTGPTGSGKTTTLYTFLNELNNDEVKIITLEDPVEYQLEGVNQVHVNADIGLTFASGLRSIVRQDPDVIMLGEIRDKETAQIALQSSLTGHLVFSTVHTNDAPSAYTRLMDLGVEEFLLNAGLVAIVAQRLVRKLCPHCAAKDERQAEFIERYELNGLMQQNGLTVANMMRPVGCDECGGTGYKGRVAIIEYLKCDDTIKSLPKGADFIQKAQSHQRSEGRRNLVEDGMLKALQGATTIDEVLRVAG